MAYLSDVPMGGYTVFPFVGAFIKPQKVKLKAKIQAKFSNDLTTNHSIMKKKYSLCYPRVLWCPGGTWTRTEVTT